MPVGFDAWMANGGGDYMGPHFGTKNLAPFTGIADAHDTAFTGSNRWGNYTTSVVGNVSTAWLRHIHRTTPDKPFFAYVAPKAARASLALDPSHCPL
jgi:N-acetylglucosamine-6-sulfatase